jgi:hypothetical protein
MSRMEIYMSRIKINFIIMKLENIKNHGGEGSGG